jgi:hypothetical protein
MKIGIMLNDIGPNQLAFQCAKQVNEAISTKNNIDSFYMFAKNVALETSEIATTVDSIADAFFFDGLLIATNIELAKYAIRSYKSEYRCLYLSEPEWSLYGLINYIENINILSNIEIVVASREIYNALYNYSGIKALAIVPDFNLKGIANEFRFRK